MRTPEWIRALEPNGPLCTNSSLGDTAISFLKADAKINKKDMDGFLAIELAPDSQVGADSPPYAKEQSTLTWKVRKFILQTAEQEGVEL